MIINWRSILNSQSTGKGQTFHLNLFIVPLLFITLIFSVIEYSNTNTHLTLLQKPGNYHDDSRLTNAVRNADSLGGASEDIGFGRGLVIPAYYLYLYFDIETNGRRIIAALIILASFVYLLILLARYQVLDKLGLLFFAFLFSISGGLTIYASTGLLSYPLLIFMSVTLVHILLRYAGCTLSVHNYLVISTIFTLAVLLSSRIILAVCAVGFALSFGNVVWKQAKASSFLSNLRSMVLLLALPITVTMLLLDFITPSELTNPHRALERYFFTSSYPHTLTGAADFFSKNTARLFLTATSPHPFVAIPGPAAWINSLLGVFFLIGLVTSWKKKAFYIAVFFLTGTLAHIILNLGTLVPYGILRYFLPFFIAYPVLTALGISQVSQGFCTLLPKRFRASSATVIYATSVAVIAVMLLQYQFAGAKSNAESRTNFTQGISAAMMAHNKNDTAIVLDVWTVDTLKADQWDIVDDVSYVLNTHIKTAWRRQLPEDQDDLNKWISFLEEQQSFIAITSVAFSKQYYGPLYDAALDQFEITSRPNVPAYHFTEFLNRESEVP